MNRYAYHLVDVFTTHPLEGNALAVFSDATGMSERTMQRVAREMNLSETTFVLPAQSQAGRTRVRIFTPAYEMRFAGHPTLGTAFVLRRLGMVAADARTFVLDENIGPVAVRVDAGDDPLLWLTTPPIERLGAFPADRCAEALSLREDELLPNIPCELRSAGNPVIYVAVRDRDTVDRAVVNVPAFEELVRERTEPTCIFVFAPTQRGAYSRMFGPEFGIVEDPATGSATGPLAAIMMQHRLVRDADGTAFASEQGFKMGRPSILHVLVHGKAGCDGIEVGGNVAYVASAAMELPAERQ